MKKLMCLLLVLTMLFGLSTTALAANDIPVLTLEKNEYNSNGERHIKVSWTGKSGTSQIQIDDDMNFGSPTIKNTKNKYWNFVLKDNVDATYYVRVRIGSGNWSEVIVAEGKEVETPIKGNSYFETPKITIPNITNSVRKNVKVIVTHNIKFFK